MRNDFPFFKQQVHDRNIIYFDNAATTQKPQVVLDALINFYTKVNANIHRAVYHHAELATQEYETARATLAAFIHADPSEIVFTRNATEGINIVATSWLLPWCKPGDEIVLTALEHHANLLPWYEIARVMGIVIKLVPLEKDGTITAQKIASYITPRTKLVSIVHHSHVTGARLPIAEITAYAHAMGAYILVDAAQSIAHQSIDVQKLNVDFLVFSGHKMVGPTGIGVLYVAKRTHDMIKPYQWGGGMVKSVQLPSPIVTQEIPHKLEAGTPSIAQAIGLAAAVRYLNFFDREAMQQHEASLCAQLLKGLQQFSRIHIVGPQDELVVSGHLVSFWIEGIHAHDAAWYLDRFGIAVRAGNHCAQPLIEALGGNPLLRVSFFWYNMSEEVDQFISALEQLLHDFP